MADTTETLANCPFCGESAEKTAGFDEVETPLFSVWCTECLAQSSLEYSEAEAIAAWNRRSDGWRTARAEALNEAATVADGQDGCGGGYGDYRSGWDYACGRIADAIRALKEKG